MRRWPWIVTGMVGLVVVGVAAIDGQWALLGTPWLIPTLAAAAAGAVLASRVPSNPVGPLLMVIGVGALLSFAGLLADPPRPAPWLKASSNALNTVSIAMLSLVLIRFPHGTLPSRRWRWVEILVLIVGVIGGAAALINNGWGGDVTQAITPGPLRDEYGPLGDLLSGLFFPGLLVTFVAALGAVVVRFRRSSGDERLQIRWLLFAAALVVAASMSVGVNTAQGTWEEWMMSVAFAAVPAAIGVAVLRYRLYDLDLVISRTLLVGMLGGFITAVYALVVVGVGSLIGGTGDLALSIGSTALVAVLFEPVRSLAQRAANRLVFGSRATPYEVLSDLTGRMSQAESHEGLLGRMATRLADGTGAERAIVWSEDGSGLSPVAVHPDGPVKQVRSVAEIAGWVVPVIDDGVTIGALSVELDRGEQLTPTERRLVEDLAVSAGLVLRRARLDAELQDRVAEVADSRRRLLGAEDGERRQIERTLEKGVQQEVLAVKIQLAHTVQVARDEGMPDAADILEQLTSDAQGAIDQIRTLARGIFPALLETEGLGSALVALVDQAPIDAIAAIEDLGDLPRDVEGAVYFSISEAITNAVKHGNGPVQVAVRRSVDALEFEVSDSGPGFDPATAQRGSGLTNLSDRVEGVGGSLEIETAPGSATIVRGRVPNP